MTDYALTPSRRAADRVKLRGEIPSLMSRPRGCELHTRCIYAQKDKCYVLPPGVSQAERGHTYTCH